MVDRKFIKSSIVEGWEVLSDSGFVDIKMLHETVPYTLWTVKTENHALDCADLHIVFDSNHQEVFVKDLNIGDLILTSNGPEEVTYLHEHDKSCNMFDIEVDSFDQSYYTDGILSHNTATAALYLLWYAMFYPDKNILITSYKWQLVDEIMARIRYAYESCPDFLRGGTTTYSSKQITFDNNSSIVGQTVTENTGRGLSVSLLYCVDGGTMLTVRDKDTKEVKNISIESLYTELDNSIMMGMSSSKPKLRIQFDDCTFMDVDEDTSFYVNEGIKTTIENIIHGDSIIFGDESLKVHDIYLLDADGNAIV